jgi:hypothetical protein
MGWWDKVTSPLNFAGLGIPNLQFKGWALQMPWLWFQKTGQNKPWGGLDLPIQSQVNKLFDCSMVTQVENGSNTLFWSDKCLNGNSILCLAPEVTAKVDKRLLLPDWLPRLFISIRGLETSAHHSPVGIQQYLLWWDALQQVVLTNEEDKHEPRHDVSGRFSSKSCCKIFLMGSIKFEPWKRLWKSPPPQCKLFHWLAITNKCWTADSLHKNGLPYPEACPPCDEDKETIQYFLTSRVFARQF